MDGNKDEALRCMRIAEEAIASGDKQRALKFIKISHRLNPNLPVAALLDACQKLGSAPPQSSGAGGSASKADNDGHGLGRSQESPLSEERSYTEEHVKLISQVRRNQDYYAILGVDKTCSVEEIRKAYRKLSLKVHPDKNKAPGSEEAFKKVSKAFKCLSESDSRRQYDQTGLVEEFEHNVRHNVVRRRRRTGHDLFDDDIDPDEIFRAFFGQGDLFRASQAYRARRAGSQRREEPSTAGFSFMIILQILPFLLIFLLAYLPFTEPEYSLFKNYSYQFPKTTQQHEVEFFVKSSDFDARYPPGSTGRADFEDNVIKDYKNMLWRYCHVEMQRRQWNKKLRTPNCDKLQKLQVA